MLQNISGSRLMDKKQALVIIGSSTGAIDVLGMLFTDLKAENVSVIIVQHIIQNFIHRVAMRINRISDMEITVARDGEQIEPGHVYFAPDDFHLILQDNEILRYYDGDKHNRFKPSIDILMNSVVPSTTKQIIGIILTGMATDGVQGMVHIKKMGGFTIAQDPLTATIDSMPKCAIDTGCIDLVATPKEIRKILVTFDSTGTLPPMRAVPEPQLELPPISVPKSHTNKKF